MDMLLQELLRERQSLIDEDIPIRDAGHMAAYVITVAEAYDAAPRLEPSAVPIWKAMALQNETVLLRQIASTGVRVSFIETDPYFQEGRDNKLAMRYMLWDMVVNKQLLIWNGFTDDHPVFSAKQNAIYRAVHDYYGHGKLRTIFKKQIEAMGLGKQKPTPEQLEQILPNVQINKGGNIGHEFTLRGEINAYLTHAKLLSPKTLPAMFTELIAQVCYNTVVGSFDEQKVAVMHGFDYHRIGQATSPSVQQRIDQLITLFETEKIIQIHIKTKPHINVAEVLASVSR